jgi:hypothetical protein
MQRARRVPLAPGTAQMLAEAQQITLAEAEQVLENAAQGQMWRNDKYTVIATAREDGSVQELSIRRNDRRAVHDWRDFQRIKNEVAGAEVEGAELYPAMSRLMDSANQYYLYCLPPGERFPMGYGQRLVTDSVIANSRQRPPPPEWVEPSEVSS